MEISEPAPWVAGPPAGEEGGDISPKGRRSAGRPPTGLGHTDQTLHLYSLHPEVFEHLTYTASILKCSNT